MDVYRVQGFQAFLSAVRCEKARFSQINIQIFEWNTISKEMTTEKSLSQILNIWKHFLETGNSRPQTNAYENLSLSLGAACGCFVLGTANLKHPRPLGTTTQMLWARSVKVSSYLCSSQWLEVTLCKDCLSCSIRLVLINIQPQISSPWGLVRIFLPSESYLFSKVLFYIKYVSFLNFLVLFYSFPKCYSCLHKHIVPALEVVMCFIFPGLHTIWTHT